MLKFQQWHDSLQEQTFKLNQQHYYSLNLEKFIFIIGFLTVLF